MNDEVMPSSKFELFQNIEASWDELQILLGQLSQAQLTQVKDKQGWTVKDHLVHLIAWERSALFFLQGTPRHEALGIDEQTYLSGDTDKINAQVQKREVDLPLSMVLDAFRDTHQQLLAHLHVLTDADLERPYRNYLPNEPGEGNGPPAMKVVYDNTAGHYREHMDWIKALVSGM